MTYWEIDYRFDTARKAGKEMQERDNELTALVEDPKTPFALHNIHLAERDGLRKAWIIMCEQGMIPEECWDAYYWSGTSDRFE